MASQNKVTLRAKRAEYNRKWRQNNKEYYSDYIKKYQNKNRERVNKNAAKWRLNNPIKSKEVQLKFKYKITYNEFKMLLIKQKGLCAICKTKPKKSLHIDHCHKTKSVRGLLCSKCNMGLGLFNDSFKLLTNASKYIKLNK